ncbi:MAG TPA: hypothetical protein DCX27_19025 [Balneola sp.]|nr:hypothetical protein [Balneola sp.]
MGNFTIALEKLTQSATDIKQAGIRGAQRTLFKKLDKFTPAIDKTATAIGEFAKEANANNKNLSKLATQFLTALTNQKAQTNAITTLARKISSGNSKKTPPVNKSYSPNPYRDPPATKRLGPT